MNGHAGEKRLSGETSHADAQCGIVPAEGLAEVANILLENGAHLGTLPPLAVTEKGSAQPASQKWLFQGLLQGLIWAAQAADKGSGIFGPFGPQGPH